MSLHLVYTDESGAAALIWRQGTGATAGATGTAAPRARWLLYAPDDTPGIVFGTPRGVPGGAPPPPPPPPPPPGPTLSGGSGGGTLKRRREIEEPWVDDSRDKVRERQRVEDEMILDCVAALIAAGVIQ